MADMTTIIIEENSPQAKKFLEYARTLPFATVVEGQVNIYDDEPDAFLDSVPYGQIPGLPYTDEEKIASVRRSMKDVRAGRTVSMGHMRAKHPMA